jgi:type VI secretion system secreted protein VgrG
MLPFAALLCDPSPGLAVPILRTAGDFAVLAGSEVTNTGSTTILGSGNVGVTPGTSITPGASGFTFGTGTTHSADGVAQQARIDAFTGIAPISAFGFLGGLSGATNLSGQVLGTGGTILTLNPGVYSFSSSAQLTGALTLNNQGNNNAVFVFQIGSTLTTAPGSSVLLAGAGTGDGVFWVVGSSATLDTTTSFEGNILAATAITLNTGATIGCGSALARDAAVTMDTNTIGVGCGGGFQSAGDTFALLGPGAPGGGLAPVPEPSTLFLFGSSLAGVGAMWRRYRHS